MTDVFSPVDELRRNGLIGNTASPSTERILGTLTRSQVDVFVQVNKRVDATRACAPFSDADDARLASTMTRAMGWDRPSSTLVDAEVEGMSVAAVEVKCACLCTGGGGGGGA